MLRSPHSLVVLAAKKETAKGILDWGFVLTLLGVFLFAGALGWKLAISKYEGAPMTAVIDPSNAQMQRELFDALTRTMSEDNARLRRELEQTQAQLTIARTTTPAWVWALAASAAMLGLALGLLPVSWRGVARMWADEDRRTRRDRPARVLGQGMGQRTSPSPNETKSP